MVSGTFRIICVVAASVFALIGIGCIGGWAANEKHNDSLVKSKCKILDHYINIGLCTSTKCDSDGHNCHITHYSCFTGYIDITVYESVEAQTVVIPNKRMQIGWKRTKYHSQVVNALSEYPVGSLRDCFYQKSEQGIPTGHVQMGLNPEQSVFIAALVFFGLTGVVLIVWGIAELISCIVS